MYFGKKGSAYRFSSPLKAICTGRLAINLCSIEHEEVRNRYREAVLNTSNPEQSTDPHQQMEYEELQKFINNTLEKLPVRRRQIFEMHRLEGRKYVEIATQLSLSVKTVEAEMTKALRTLREEVETYIHMK